MASAFGSRWIQYVGTKERKTDNVTESGLAWKPGEVIQVPEKYALGLLAHPAVWVEVDGPNAPMPQATQAAIAALSAPEDPKDLEILALNERIAELEAELEALKAAPPKRGRRKAAEAEAAMSDPNDEAGDDAGDEPAEDEALINNAEE